MNVATSMTISNVELEWKFVNGFENQGLLRALTCFPFKTSVVPFNHVTRLRPQN